MNKFVRKSPGGEVYTWSPETSVRKAAKIGRGQAKFCNAVAGGIGEDFFVKYVYDATFDKQHKEHRIAYVECGYVE